MNHKWNVFYNLMGRCLETIQARTKAEAEEISFQKFGRPMLIDLDREAYHA